MFTSFQRDLFAELALGALHTQNDLLRRPRLLVMNRTSLSTETTLFPLVPSLSLSERSFLGRLVLSHFVKGVLLTLLSSAEGFAGLVYVHHVVCGSDEDRLISVTICSLIFFICPH